MDINPNIKCGARDMGSFNKIRDAVESAASVAGNYLLPGSSLVTDNLVSKGSQQQLGSTLGQIAQIGSGLAGGGIGSGLTGIPAASDIGAGWTNALNGAGNIISPGSNIGTAASNSFSSLLNGGGASGATGAVPSSFPTASASAPAGAGIPSLVNAESALGASPEASIGSGLGKALSAGVGGGTSSYALPATLAGSAYSLYANDKAQKDLVDAGNAANAQLAPYTYAGGAATTKLSDLLGTSGNSSNTGYGSLTTPFTPGDLTQDPGYQFNLAQGNQAIDRKAAASGNYFSGSALKAAQDYGQGLADNTYNAAYNRNLQSNQQLYGELAGQSGQGANAAGTAGNIDTQIGSAKANSGISTGNILNSTLSSLLNGNGAKRPVNIGGQIVYI